MAPRMHPSRAVPVPRRYTYNVMLIRRDCSYSVQEIAELFHLHVNAVRRWLKASLKTIDDRKPQLIHGSDLIAFLRQRQKGRKQPCAPDQMYCCRCRAPRRPAGGQVIVERLNARQIMIRGTCELCGARMNRGGSLARFAQVEQSFTVTKSPTPLAEPACPPVLCDMPQGA